MRRELESLTRHAPTLGGAVGPAALAARVAALAGGPTSAAGGHAHGAAAALGQQHQLPLHVKAAPPGTSAVSLVAPTLVPTGAGGAPTSEAWT